MKLRNKKTGEIVEKFPDRFVINSGEQIRQYDSLAELNAEWEDVPEEPKELWAIDQFGEPINVTGLSRLQLEKLRQYGNIFATEEEAELAVRKLKAWKRLKDKGFRFVRIDEQNEGHRVGQYIEFEMVYHFTPNARQIGYDLDLLFGGEE